MIGLHSSNRDSLRCDETVVLYVAVDFMEDVLRRLLDNGSLPAFFRYMFKIRLVMMNPINMKTPIDSNRNKRLVNLIGQVSRLFRVCI